MLCACCFVSVTDAEVKQLTQIGVGLTQARDVSEVTHPVFLLFVADYLS